MYTFPLSRDETADIFDHACTGISEDALRLMECALSRKRVPTAKVMLGSMLGNVKLAGAKHKPVCQSPGFPTAWVRFGDNMSPAGIAEVSPFQVTKRTCVPMDFAAGLHLLIYFTVFSSWPA